MRSIRGLDIGSAEALVVVASEPVKGYDTAGVLDGLLPAGVLLDLADHGLVTMGEGRVTRTGVEPQDGVRGYERAVLDLGAALDGPLPDVVWALADTLRPLPHVVATELVAEGRVDSVKNTLLKMDFGYRFPVLDTDFRDAVRSRVQAALESGDVASAFGRTALLLAAGRADAQVFPGVDASAMQAVATGQTSLDDAGHLDVGTAVVLQQLTATIQQTVLR
jgi:hypothetical protein